MCVFVCGMNGMSHMSVFEGLSMLYTYNKHLYIHA